MAAAIPRIVEMESKSFATGSTSRQVFQLLSLPEGANLLGVMFEIIVNTDAGGGTCDASEIVEKLVTGVTHRSDFLFIKFDGNGFNQLFHHMHGKANQGNAEIDGTSGIDQRATFWVPIQDEKSCEPGDQSIPCESFRGTSIEVNFSDEVDFAGGAGGGGATATGNWTVRSFAMLEPRSGMKDPVKQRIEYEDWGGQTILLKRGVFTHIGIYKQSAASIALSEIDHVDLNFNGEPVFQNVRTESTVWEFNRVNVMGGFQTPTIGSVDDDAPEQLKIDLYPFLPVYTPPSGYLLSKCPRSRDYGDVTFKLSGSMTDPRVYYRLFDYKSESDYKAAFAAQGGRGSFIRTPKTASKIPPPPADVLAADPALARKWSEIGRLIPGKLLSLKAK